MSRNIWPLKIVKSRFDRTGTPMPATDLPDFKFGNVFQSLLLSGHCTAAQIVQAETNLALDKIGAYRLV